MKKYILLFGAYFFVFISVAQNKTVFHLSLDSAKEVELNSYWKFRNGDNADWALFSFNDTDWDTVNTQLPFNAENLNTFKGIAWFRIHLVIDSSIDTLPFFIRVFQQGASQIFLDGKLINSSGIVSGNFEKEKTYNPKWMPFPFSCNDKKEHVLAVRYSNLNFIKLFKKYHAVLPGFSISITQKENALLDFINLKFIFTSSSLILGIFFLTLSLVHFLLYVFFRKNRTNLHYSLFVFILGLIFIIPIIINNTSNPLLEIKTRYYYICTLPVFFNSLLGLQYSLFYKSFGKYFWFSSIVMCIAVIFKLIDHTTFSKILIFSFIVSTVVASFVIVIKSVLKKIDGSWIIAVGSFLFLIFLGFVIVKISITGNDSITTNSYFSIALILLSIISIPVSMSIYLARDFAQTNKKLGKKLIEVEDLSKKTIEQEQEKQRILETQKEVLEKQVEERTSEIAGQKKVIEEKNKDITESIDYAKTIQQAILPAKELKNSLFPDSFILFKPKDIVSGDFYWFTEKDGKKIIACCDCTGHGVPGALMSMIGNNGLNQIVIEKEITSPDDVLNHLHKVISGTLNQGKEIETKDGMDAAIVTFEKNGSVTFSGAHRPIWIVTNNTFKEIRGDNYAIGGIEAAQERKFTKHEIKVQKGDVIYLFTDGFADQFNETDEKLMTRRFKDLIISVQNKTIREQEEYLHNFIESWKGKGEQTDDILVIGIRIT